MDAGDWIVSAVAVLFFACLALCGIEMVAFSRHEFVSGKVCGVSWTPESNGTGTGYAFGPRGGGVAIVSTHQPEEFSALVLVQGEVETCSVSKVDFPRMSKGDDVTVDEKVGNVSGFCYSRKARPNDQ